VKRSKKFKHVALVAAALSSVMLVHTAAPARADASPEGAEASVSGAAVDAWSVVGDTLTTLVGERSCTITASAPVVSANQVAGSGSVACNKTYAKLTLTVCIQAKQAFVTEETTWQELRCNPTKAALNSKSLNDTVVAQCLPQPWIYRTQATAEGFFADSSEREMLAIIHSPRRLYDCGL